MLTARRSAPLVALAIVTAAAVVISCRDTSSPTPERIANVTPTTARAVSYENPMQWVGDLHGKIELRFLHELAAAKFSPQAACAKVMEWLATTSDIPTQARSVGTRATLQNGVGASPVCFRRQLIGQAPAIGRAVSLGATVNLVVTGDTMTTAGQAVLDSILTVVEALEESGADSAEAVN